MDITTIAFLLLLAWFSLQSGHLFFAIVLALSAVFVALGSSAKAVNTKSQPSSQNIVIGGGSTYQSGYRIGLRPDWPAKPAGYWMNMGVADAISAAFKLFERIVGTKD